jgi:DNA-binding XRE family transcriptional regulator
MRKVDDYIKEKMDKDPGFKAHYAWTIQKAAIAKKIINYRTKNNLTQSQLARELGVTQQYISKIEEGEFSNLETAEKILYLLGYGVKLQIVPLHKKHTKTLATT